MADQNVEEDGVTRDHYVKYGYAVSEVAYDVDETTREKLEETAKLEAGKGGVQRDSLREAIEDFLQDAKYDEKLDGKIFYAQQGEQTYVGFARMEKDKKIHERLALFFKVDVEVVTKMTAHDVSLADIQEALK